MVEMSFQSGPASGPGSKCSFWPGRSKFLVFSRKSFSILLLYAEITSRMSFRCWRWLLVIFGVEGVFERVVKRVVKLFHSFLAYRSELLVFFHKSFFILFLGIKLIGMWSFSWRTLFLVVEMQKGIFEVKNRFFQKYFL